MGTEHQKTITQSHPLEDPHLRRGGLVDSPCCLAVTAARPTTRELRAVRHPGARATGSGMTVVMN